MSCRRKPGRRAARPDTAKETERREASGSRGSAASGKAGDVPPWAPEEVWQFREQKRQSAVALFKKSMEYQHLESCRRKPGGRAATAAVPHSPDPWDRSISKRAWERSIFEWKACLRMWVGWQAKFSGSGMVGYHADLAAAASITRPQHTQARCEEWVCRTSRVMALS